MSDETQQNSTKLNMLSPTQRVFVAARARNKSVAESAREAGINRTTPAATWDMDLINAAILEMQQALFSDAAKAVFHLVPDAINCVGKEIKRGGPVGLAAAKEVFDRAWGKAVQRNELGGIGGGAIPLEMVDYRTGLPGLAPSSEEPS